ncbi:MAG: phosphatase PAP2 family protein [Betaproteobacteria bacterium]|nr:phosphatase PAP2 family protein [Betaproteobacteria bacterium]
MKEWLYDWGGLNVALFHAVNANHAAWLDRLMLALTWAGDHDRFSLYLAVLTLVTWWRFARDPAGARAWVLALATFSIGYLLDGVLVIGLKSAFDFPRPPAVLPADSLIIVGPPEFRHGFPSGHASFATLVAAMLWPGAKNLATRIALALFVVGVCLSRSYLGMHFPADVLFGSLKSLLVVIAVRATLTKRMPAARG